MSDQAIFKALADPTRRQILEDLRAGELTVGEICEGFDISGPAISRHLSVLKSAGLVHDRRDGSHVRYRLDDGRLALSVGGFLSTVCPTQVSVRRKRGK